MAEENDSGQEKTEEASTRKLEKAREEGQIPRSRDLTTTAILLLGAIGLMVFGQYMGSKLMDVTRYNFTIHAAEFGSHGFSAEQPASQRNRPDY